MMGWEFGHVAVIVPFYCRGCRALQGCLEKNKLTIQGEPSNAIIPAAVWHV